MTPEILAALDPLVVASSRLGIDYYIGGSVASSAHGLPRATLDVDLVMRLRASQIPDLVSALEDLYYVDAAAVREAVRAQRSFNLIHLETMLKIDVFILKNSAFDQSAFQRRESRAWSIDAQWHPFFATAEDTVLHKLSWYRDGGGISERQWNDVIGILKVQGTALDRAYLHDWGSRIDVGDLLARALHDAGLNSA